jgi:hypothetical protein
MSLCAKSLHGATNSGFFFVFFFAKMMDVEIVGHFGRHSTELGVGTEIGKKLQ